MKASAHDKIICGLIFSVFFGLSAYAATKDAGWSCLGFWVFPFGYILKSIWRSDKVSFLIKGMFLVSYVLGGFVLVNVHWLAGSLIVFFAPPIILWVFGVI
jgi:hypothetical protein